MHNFMMRFARFMQGRYGYDQLGKFLILLGFITGIIGSLFHQACLSLLGNAVLCGEIYRMFSRNLVRRGIENDRYMHVVMMAKHRFLAMRKRWQDHRNHYYVCPQCGQIVRIPKGHGKITVTCPNCRREFDRRS